MKKHNQIFIALICVLFVFSILLSVSFIAHEANHDCVGPECEICMQIDTCRETIKKVSLIVPVLSMVFVAVIYTIIKAIVLVCSFLKQATPYTLKVKLLI